MAPKRTKSSTTTGDATAAAKTTTPLQKKKNKRSLSDLKTLGTELLSSRAHINNLPILLFYVTPSTPPTYIVEALLSLQSFLSPLLPNLPSTAAAAGDVSDPEVVYRTWLRSKFNELVSSLMEIVVSPQCEDNLREVVLDAIMEFVKRGKAEDFNSSLYYKLVHAIVYSSVEVEFLLESLASSYFKYIDVRFHTFNTVKTLCEDISKKITTEGDDSETSLEGSIKKLHFILSQIPSLGDLTAIEMWSSGFKLKEDCKHKDENSSKKQKMKSTENGLSNGNASKRMRSRFSEAWMSFLKLPLPLEVYKEVLVNLHQAVIPYLSKPKLLSDFLTRSYDIGGVVSVMALSGLFILMTEHSLNYPDFYEKLYALLKPSIFMAKHRSKFFELLDACLKSPLFPAYMAAAFTKKLSRLSLKVPPSGALIVIALVHNLLRRHPSINCLVHQEIDEKNNVHDTTSPEDPAKADGMKASIEKQGIDLFDDEESDLKKTNALRSSLWEIDTLCHHYCPPVSRFVLSLENDLTVRSKTTEMTVGDFSSGSYSSIFREEMRRRVKQVPLAFYKATPTNLFSDSDFPGWTFTCDETKVV